MLGHHRHASETLFKWRFAGGPMMDRLWWYLDSPTLINKKKVKVGPPRTKRSGSAHAGFKISLSRSGICSNKNIEVRKPS